MQEVDEIPSGCGLLLLKLQILPGGCIHLEVPVADLSGAVRFGTIVTALAKASKTDSARQELVDQFRPTINAHDRLSDGA